jgi:hypothetical protein
LRSWIGWWSFFLIFLWLAHPPLDRLLPIQNLSTQSWKVGSPMEDYCRQCLLSRARSLLIIRCKTAM